MYRPTLLLGSIAVLPTAYGVTFGGPAPTNAIEQVNKIGDGWTPIPTQAPSVAELRRRQDSTISGLNTCGWIGTDTIVGNYSDPIVCSTGRTCALYTASNIGMAGCCSGSDTQSCGWAKGCVNYDAYTKKSCDSDCEINPFIWKCSQSATPYCVTWTYPEAGVADYGCATYNSGVLTVLQTAEDEVSYYWKTLVTYSGDAVTGYDERAISSTSVPDGTSDVTGIGGGETDTPFTVLPSPEPKKKKSAPVGAIVGGVVGGVVALALLGAALFFFCVRRRKRRQIESNQAMVNAQQTQGPPQPEYKPPMQNYAPPPTGVHSPPPQPGFFAPPQDQKTNYQVHQQGVQSPVLSSPPSPAPAYVQQYSPMPAEGGVQYPGRESYQGDAISHQPPPGGYAAHGNVHELGGR